MSAFIDEVEVFLKAGEGGNGAATFRREKHVPRGGPDGGDGGRGGNIVLETNSNVATLLDFRPGKHYRATRGGDGLGKNQYGLNGQDLVLKVPVGTQVRDADTNELLADLSRLPQREILLPGGKGGRGNSHFVSSIQQAPKFAENGEPADERRVKLVLKLLADVGLLGFPNVGKSTLLSRISAAKPKIADYPFTTLVPNLGVVRATEEFSFVVADVPGLIENAHQGAGLGIQFLKHLERTRLLVHLVDVSGVTGRDPIEDYHTINRELAAFSPELAALPQVIALSRMDVAPDRDALRPLAAFFEQEQGLRVFAVSSVTGENVEPLVYHLAERLLELPREAPASAETVRITLQTHGGPNGKVPEDDPRRFSIARDPADAALVVTGKGLERIVAMTNMDNEDGVRRLQRRMEGLGVFRKLAQFGAKEGDTVRIRGVEFDYVDEDAEDENNADESDEEQP